MKGRRYLEMLPSKQMGQESSSSFLGERVAWVLHSDPLGCSSRVANASKLLPLLILSASGLPKSRSYGRGAGAQKVSGIDVSKRPVVNADPTPARAPEGPSDCGHCVSVSVTNHFSKSKVYSLDNVSVKNMHISVHKAYKRSSKSIVQKEATQIQDDWIKVEKKEYWHNSRQEFQQDVTSSKKKNNNLPFSPTTRRASHSHRHLHGKKQEQTFILHHKINKTRSKADTGFSQVATTRVWPQHSLFTFQPNLIDTHTIRLNCYNLDHNNTPLHNCLTRVTNSINSIPKNLHHINPTHTFKQQLRLYGKKKLIWNRKLRTDSTWDVAGDFHSLFLLRLRKGRGRNSDEGLDTTFPRHRN